MKSHYHKLVLLIDSDLISSFFNKIIIKQAKIAEKVISVGNCYDALDFITPKKTLLPVPEIIFMDLKTPLMNGWEFLEKYNELEKSLQQSVIIIFTDELDEQEQIKLSQYSFVKSFTNKNLDIKTLSKINGELIMKNTLSKVSNS